jgi:hypothetical protein
VVFLSPSLRIVCGTSKPPTYRPQLYFLRRPTSFPLQLALAVTLFCSQALATPSPRRRCILRARRDGRLCCGSDACWNCAGENESPDGDYLLHAASERVFAVSFLIFSAYICGFLFLLSSSLTPYASRLQHVREHLEMDAYWFYHEELEEETALRVGCLFTAVVRLNRSEAVR